MKYSTLSLGLALALTSALAERSAVDGEASTPVALAVRCVGADLSALSLPTGSAIGTLLQDSYNGVVALDDADDSELSDVTYSGGRVAKGSTKTGYWKGTWGCDSCTKDDTAAIKVWGLELVAGLVATGDAALAKVTACSIVMTIAPIPANSDEPPNANVIVDCGKTNMAALGVAKGTFLAHAVQRSFTKVHGNIVDDDSSLDHVVYQGPPTMTLGDKLSRKPRPANLNGLYSICRMCPHFDDDLLVQVQGAALMAWQAELVALLQQSNYPVFRKITKCQIKLLPLEDTTDVREHAMTIE